MLLNATLDELGGERLESSGFEGETPDPFLSYHNFELAFTRLMRSGNKEYKQFYRHLFPCCNFALRENLTDLIEDIKHGTYKPDLVAIIFQPKKSGVLRPLTLLSLRDLIVYQALGEPLGGSVRGNTGQVCFEAKFGRPVRGQGQPVLLPVLEDLLLRL